MKSIKIIFFLFSCSAFSQAITRIEPENFQNIALFGSNLSFNDSEIAVFGINTPVTSNNQKLFLFQHSGSTVTPNGILECPESGSVFVGDIEMMDEYLFVGSISNSTQLVNAGAVFIFKKVNQQWTYLSKLLPPVLQNNGMFGGVIKWHNNQLFVFSGGYDEAGNPNVNNGAIYVFNHNGDDFNFSQLITGPQNENALGAYMQFESDTMVTLSENNATTNVHRFEKNNGQWQLVHSQNFGHTGQNYWISVGFHNNLLIVHRPLDFNSESPARFDMLQWNTTQNVWTFTQQSIYPAGDYINYGIAVENGHLFVIAYGEYILQLERKRTVQHYTFVNNQWIDTGNFYSGFGTWADDDFGTPTKIKNGKVGFGNASEAWGSQFTTTHGGAYFLNFQLSTPETTKEILTLYPNPTNGVVYVNEAQGQMKEVFVYDSTGKQILNKVVNLQTIDLSQFPSGLYFCTLVLENGTQHHQKIIKK
ncbi:MAG: T9SS type A sorting domain-containing protein [Flavobacterium sp.]